MGVLTPPGDDPNCLASKPKERQFQVVPVPAVFTRGRWKCCDFREAQLAESGILEFVKPHKHVVDATNQNASTIIVTNVAPNQLKALQKQQQLMENEGKHVESLPEPIILLPTPSSDSSTLVESLTTMDTHPAYRSVSTALSSQDATNLLNDLHVQGLDHEITRQASSATINIPPTNNPSKVDALDISAIDSKIEQAMDLVKSHVTFAVRQEVEELKTTITTLQAKVAMLESENQYLKRFAPPDILANLPNLIQTKMPHSIHKAESMISCEQQSSSRNLSPAPSELDEPPITMVPHHSLPPSNQQQQQHPRSALKIPAVASVAMMDSLSTPPPSAAFPSMGIFEVSQQTQGMPRSASAIETSQIPSINENTQEDHTRQMTPPQQQQPQLHPSHSTSHMVRQYAASSQAPFSSTPQPLTYPQQPPLMHSYIPLSQMQTGPPPELSRQMSPPMSIPMNQQQQQHQQHQQDQHQRHFSPPMGLNSHESYQGQHHQQQQLQQQYAHSQQDYHQQQHQAMNPFSPNAQSHQNAFQHFSNNQQQQQPQQGIIPSQQQVQHQHQQQQQNYQNIPVMSESQQQQQQPVMSHQQQQQHQQNQQHQQPSQQNS